MVVVFERVRLESVLFIRKDKDYLMIYNLSYERFKTLSKTETR